MLSSERRNVLFTRVEHATEGPMLLLAIVFLAAAAAPEVVDLSPEWILALEGLTWFVWALFAFELLVKTYLAPDRRRYLLTHWLDVVTVLVPFLRPVRLLGLVVLGVRFWAEARTVLRRRTMGVIGIGSLVAVGVSAQLVYLVERGGEGPIQSFPDALWWAAATITTVGYGDVFPKTPTGRAAAVVLMLIGISLFGLLTARVAAFFVETEDRRDQPGNAEILERLDRLERLLTARSAPASTSGDSAAHGPADEEARGAS
jgi:voltage-gated potassium channel